MRCVFLPLALSLCIVLPRLLAGGVYLTENDPSWKKLHPSYKNYEKARDKGNWQQAAKLARTFDTTNDAWAYQKEYYEVFDQAGDFARALQHFERVLYIESVEDHLKAGLALHLSEAAQFAQRHALTSQYTIINALSADMAGNPEVAFAVLQNMAESEFAADLRPDLQRPIALRGFEKCVAREEWPAAAALAAFILEAVSPGAANLASMAEACEKAGDIELAFRCHESAVGVTTSDHAKRIDQATKAAAFMLRHGLTSRWRLTQSAALQLAGQPAQAMAVLDATSRDPANEVERETALFHLRQLVPAAFDESFEKAEWRSAVTAIQYLDQLTTAPDARFLDRLLIACEQAGHPKTAAELCLGTPINDPPERTRIYDLQGNPELIKRAAALAHKHQFSVSDRNANAWVLHLRGDSRTALAVLQGIANGHTTFYRTVETASDASAAEILSGDIYLAQGDPDRALDHYHRATYIFSYFCIEYPEDFWARTYFYETLGITRQCRALLVKGRPDLAQRELDGLVSWRADIQAKIIYRHATLDAAWTEAIQGITAAKQAGRSPATDGPTGPREVAYDVLQRIRQLEYDAAENARRRELAARPARTSEFLESWIAAQREAATIVIAADPPSAPGSFDFQGALDAQSSGRHAGRRCAFCLGSGKAGYVTGATYQDTNTGQQVFPDCSKCQGTGWR